MQTCDHVVAMGEGLARDGDADGGGAGGDEPGAGDGVGGESGVWWAGVGGVGGWGGWHY